METLLLNKKISNNEKEGVENEIFEIVDSDPFLKQRVNLEELILELDKTSFADESSILFQTGLKKTGEIVRVLSINLTELNNPLSESRRYKLTHELYHWPGQERLTCEYPSIIKNLNQWRKRLTDPDFFAVFVSYEMTIFEIGVDFGVMLNHPDFAKDCYKKHYPDIDRAVIIVGTSGRDYLYHFISGLQFVRWPSYFLADTASKSSEILKLGRALKTRTELAYSSSHPLVKQKLSGFFNLIVEKNPFSDDYLPSLYGEFGYTSLAKKLFLEYRELKESLGQKHSPNIELLQNNPLYKDCRENFMKVLG